MVRWSRRRWMVQLEPSSDGAIEASIVIGVAAVRWCDGAAVVGWCDWSHRRMVRLKPPSSDVIGATVKNIVVGLANVGLAIIELTIVGLAIVICRH